MRPSKWLPRPPRSRRVVAERRRGGCSPACRSASAGCGGRYPGLWRCALVPAALLGVRIDGLLASAARMASACREDDAANPGLALGAFIAEQAAEGRDKLSLLVPPPLAAFGLWVEQL